MALIRSLDWDDTLGNVVRVYRNLNNYRISVKRKKGSKWPVVGHVTELVLADVTFYLSVKGQQRDRAARCRSVHAWAEGRLVAQCDPDVEAPISFKYDYKVNDYFVERGTGRRLYNCRYLVVRDNQVFVSADALRAPATPPKLAQFKLTPFNLKPHEQLLSLRLGLGIA